MLVTRVMGFCRYPDMELGPPVYPALKKVCHQNFFLKIFVVVRSHVRLHFKVPLKYPLYKEAEHFLSLRGGGGWGVDVVAAGSHGAWGIIFKILIVFFWGGVIF